MIDGTGDLVEDILPLASINGLAFEDFLDIVLRTDRKRVLKAVPEDRRPELVLGRGEMLASGGERRVVPLSLDLVAERFATGRSRRCMIGASSKDGGRIGTFGTGGTS